MAHRFIDANSGINVPSVFLIFPTQGFTFQFGSVYALGRESAHYRINRKSLFIHIDVQISIPERTMRLAKMPVRGRRLCKVGAICDIARTGGSSLMWQS